jgi:thiamine pyrophosphokinase
MSRFAILLGGKVQPTTRLLEQVSGARCIAADSGIGHAPALNLVPELWVGDFDSASQKQMAEFAAIPRLEFPAEKDATDGDIAISEAFRRGATEIVLVGGFGGQFDHAMGHVTMLLAMAKRDIPCMMTSGDEEAHPLAWEVQLNGLPPGTRISIVPSSDIKGLTLKGVRWPLDNKSVPFGSTLTLSNISIGDIVVEMVAGAGLILAYPVEPE